MGAFGDNLRRQRELRNITLETISTTTKISIRMLRAIEDEHFDQLPGGVFNKGFVRAYARQVGVDEDEAVADYLSALRENQIQSQAMLPDFRRSNSKSEREPTDRDGISVNDLSRTVQLNASATKGDRGGEARIDEQPEDQEFGNRGTNTPEIEERRIEERRIEERRVEDRRFEDQHAEGLRSSGRRSSSRSKARHHKSLLVGAKLPASLLLLGLLFAFWLFAYWNHHRRNQAAQAGSSNTIAAPAGTAAGAATEGFALSARPANAPHVEAAATTHRPATANISGMNRPAGKPQSSTPKSSAPSKFTVVIRATQTSWISIIADGQPVARETLIAPANTSVRATREVVVRTGNAAGINFLVNGKEIPGSGSQGDVRTYTFDASGLRASVANEAAPPSQ